MFDVMSEPWPFPEVDDEYLYQLTLAAEAEEVVVERHVLPPDLDALPPLFLAAVLSVVDRSKLSGYDTVRLMQAHARLVSHFNSRLYADMAEVAHASHPDTTARDQIPVERGGGGANSASSHPSQR